jgi:hypothetical protein
MFAVKRYAGDARPCHGRHLRVGGRSRLVTILVLVKVRGFYLVSLQTKSARRNRGINHLAPMRLKPLQRRTRQTAIADDIGRKDCSETASGTYSGSPAFRKEVHCFTLTSGERMGPR